MDWAEAFELAEGLRETANYHLYGGGAPSSSNALSEVFPTVVGATFVVSEDWEVVVAPSDKIPPLLKDFGFPADGVRPLIGYKIGDQVYEPADVTLVYGEPA